VAIDQAKLGMAARNHWPLRLVKNQLTLETVAANLNNFGSEFALGLGLPAALFYQNNLHWDLSEFICSRQI